MKRKKMNLPLYCSFLTHNFSGPLVIKQILYLLIK